MRKVFLVLVLLGFALGGCGGVDWFPEQGVTAFSFSPESVTGVEVGSTQTSNSVTLKIRNATGAAISVSGGEYSLNGGAFTSAAGTAKDGETVAVRHTASTQGGQTVTTTLTIGDKSATFSSTTAPPIVFTPALRLNVAANTVQTSNTITVSLPGATAAISITGGNSAYSINGGPFTSNAGTIRNNDTVAVQHTSAAGTTAPTVVTVLTVGTAKAIFASSTTGVATQTIQVSGAPDTTVKTQVISLVSGSQIVSVQSGDFGEFSFDNETFFDSLTPQTVNLAVGQVIHLQDTALPTSGQIRTSTYKIGDQQTVIVQTRTN